MPTFEVADRFTKDFGNLSAADKQRFATVVREPFVPDLAQRVFRRSLRVKGVQGAPGIYEMTWAGDGRATWQYGDEKVAAEPHVIWRRIGGHEIFLAP